MEYVLRLDESEIQLLLDLLDKKIDQLIDESDVSWQQYDSLEYKINNQVDKQQ